MRARNTCSGKESHGTQVKGLRHLCERCKEARPNGVRQVQSLHATLGKGPMHPCERGKYDRSSLWKVRQVQERSKEARPNQQARQTHGRCIQGVKVDCYNIMVMQRRKERKSGRPFEVLHGPTISSGKYEHSPRVGVGVLFSEGRRST